MYAKREYRSSSKQYKGCALASSCVGKTAKQKKFSVTYYREAYERNIARVHSKKGRYMKAKRQSTVEPVFGTLTQFMGLRKINTIGFGRSRIRRNCGYTLLANRFLLNYQFPFS